MKKYVVVFQYKYMCVCIYIQLLYIRYVQLLVLLLKIGKRHLTFSKRLGRHLISLKKFI